MTKFGRPRAFPSNAIDPEFGGMELRDYFGIRIAVAMIERKVPWGEIAERAYNLADDLIAQRDKETTDG